MLCYVLASYVSVQDKQPSRFLSRGLKSSQTHGWFEEGIRYVCAIRVQLLSPRSGNYLLRSTRRSTSVARLFDVVSEQLWPIGFDGNSTVTLSDEFPRTIQENAMLPRNRPEEGELT